MFGQSLDRIRPGAVLGRTIYEDKGRPLLVPVVRHGEGTRFLRRQDVKVIEGSRSLRKGE